MVPLAFREGEAVLFWTAYALWVGLEIIGTIFQRSPGTALRRDRGSYLVLLASLYLGIGLGFAIAWLVPGATITWHRSLVFLLGIVLMLAGVAFRWYAIRVLGRYFTRDVAIQPGQRIVQAGPYRFIRHPAYTGSLLTCFGVGLALTNWLSTAAIMAGACLGYLYRVRVEERALCEAFGSEYISYMQRTSRFIPFVF